MTTAIPNSSNIPNLPGGPIVDGKGNLTPSWQGYFANLNTFLLTNFTSEGLKVPQQSAANIAGPLNVSSSTGNLLYDSTNNLLKVNLNGTYKTVTTS